MMKTCDNCNIVALNDGDELCRECSCTEFTEHVEPEGAELDLAVAKVVQNSNMEAYSDHHLYIKNNVCFIEEPPGTDGPYHYSPSINWSQGGKILAEHWDEITHELYRMFPREFPEGHDWWKQIKGEEFLKIAMQAFVRVKGVDK